VELLLSRKAKVNKFDNLGLTALDYAILNNRQSIFQKLLKHGARVNAMHQTEEPLVLAGQVGNLAMLKSLLSTGAAVNARSPRSGDTALIVATRRGNLAAVKLLLSKNADRHLKNNKGETAFDLAQKKRSEPLMAALSQ